MSNSFETSFIGETAEKTPFSELPARSLFARWCEMNDSIVPEFISREKWEARGEPGIMEKGDDGEQTLFLPKDLRLWEMMDAIKTIDIGTLVRKPELRGQRAGQIAELGETFQKAGLYLNEYLPDIRDGKDIAGDIAQEFYNYGLSLKGKVRADEEIPVAALTNEDKQKLDEWLLGRTARRKRMAGLGENPSEEQIEARRKELIQVYFKALARRGYKTEGEKPWETKTGPMRHLQDKAKRNIIKAVETPERELKTAIFRRGVEKLVTKMKEAGWRKRINEFFKTVGLDISVEQRKLYDVLKIPELKQELEEARESGDVNVIAKKELEIAGKVQKEVCAFRYKPTKKIDVGPISPPRMVETQFINCVGASVLGGGLLDELGIKYLHAAIPNHSLTFLITSDEKVFWRDFTPPKGYTKNHEITDEKIPGNGAQVEDIVNFANSPEDSGLSVDMQSPSFQKIRVNLFNPEIGLQCHILNSAGSVLLALGRDKMANKAYKQAFETYKQALEAYKQAITVDPKDPYPYTGLGAALYALGRDKEAVEAYKQAITVDPKDPYSYNGLGDVLRASGKNKEAVEAYEKFIELWNGEQFWVVRAKNIIAELKEK